MKLMNNTLYRKNQKISINNNAIRSISRATPPIRDQKIKINKDAKNLNFSLSISFNPFYINKQS